ncbi:MAG TPA: DUF1178 domain-containing protein [Parvularcula sp.]|nr:DUF1178 domain-containing protein [Parvularcula sp.]
MIKYKLSCVGGCTFEGWFRSSDDFDAQSREGRLECPYCGSADVARAIMAPAIVRGGAPAPEKEARLAHMREAMAEAARRARDYVEKNFDYVGDRFPEEARRIHYGETKHRDIYGEASGADAKELAEEGVAIAPLPPVPGAVADKKKIN